ncbi:hypothetical protein L210DRAFT_3644702 [Boletus edulis BED1]|uniref:DUF7082 domain-containing protein n=1 Tax=Boletus edulis BED1 TaxID=1328754 RepID=A0AAD4GFG2_BOLED|nr:hypothetical protein L210DRAFT_3644702 [Boletus edulis BED1]
MSLLTTASQNLNARDPSNRLTRLACSGVDLLWVMSYTPGEGNQGTLISVNFTCKTDMAIGIHIRLVVGRRAVHTHVHEMDSPGCGRWQLKGRAPSFSKQKSSSAAVPLTIQAVDEENQVVDSVTFGDFLYHDADGTETYDPPFQTSPTPTHPPSRPTLRIPFGDAKRRSPYSQPQSPPSSDSEYGSSQGSRPAPQAIRRASRQMGPEPEDTTRAIILDITTPLDDFCFGWEESELHAGRRLVRFRRLQDGNRLIVSAEKISQSEYDSEDIVISCIYREEADSCCVTSVDIIHLLQRLVDADFEVDEKNRIRRNLEGLRPITVSKTRPGFESLFQHIMDFPDPKPRKIEKDVKVFDWKLLPHALDKILSKYSLCASPTSSSPRDEVPSPFSSTMSPQELSASATSESASYDDISSHLPREPSLDAFYLSHVSPITQLASFPPECSPDSSPEMHRRSSLHEEQLQSIYLDQELLERYYQEPDILYGAPTSSGSLHSPMYTVESSTTLAHNTSTFWPANDIMLLSPTESVYSPAFGYGPSDAAESVDIYAPASYHPINTYDSFDFQTLREHSTSAVLASQQA